MIKSFSAILRPSGMLKRMLRHQGNLSTGSKAIKFCSREILGKFIRFYENGEHFILGKTDVTEEEQFNSEILRFAHASLLVSGPVGDKQRLWVDATKNPVEVWLYGMPAKKFVREAKKAIDGGKLSVDFFVEQHPDKTQEKLCHE